MLLRDKVRASQEAAPPDSSLPVSTGTARQAPKKQKATGKKLKKNHVFNSTLVWSKVVVTGVLSVVTTAL